MPEASGEWDWLAGSALRVHCALIFARGVEEDEMFEAFGLDPLSARTENWVFDPFRRCVRVGRLGWWTFAVDEPMVSLDLAVHGRNVGRRLSVGTEVVVIEWTSTPAESFEYWADGAWGTWFEPYRAYDRLGGDPDRFVPEMRQAGMVTEVAAEAEGPGDPLIAVLEMATLALGIRLPEQVAMGPLATVSVLSAYPTDAGNVARQPIAPLLVVGLTGCVRYFPCSLAQLRGVWRVNVVFRETALRTLARIRREDAGFFACTRRAIAALPSDPRPEGAVPWGTTGIYRLRAGRIRVLYEIDEDASAIYIINIGQLA